MSSPALPVDNPSPGQKRKRAPRALIACETCRSRKLRCDQASPCSHCVRLQQPCNYRSPGIQLPGARIPPSTPDSTSFTARTPEQHTVGRPAFEQDDLQTPTASSVIEAQVESQDSFGEVNRHTQGTEYYGPTGIYSFLLRLRVRARSQSLRDSSHGRHQGGGPGRPRSMRDLSIVNFLHSSDYHATGSANNNQARSHPVIPSSWQAASPSQEPATSAGAKSSHESHSHLPSPSSSHEPSVGPTAPQGSVQTTIERECLRLFFQNLHLIHPVIEESAFMERCENEIFSQRTQPGGDFLALFNAVLAVGAVTAGPDTLLMKNAPAVASIETPSFLPLKFAKLFFERSKAHLGDIFEACSLERAQTLFLLAVFCQNALKPHSCYMYSGMAVRSALAIGIPSLKGNESAPASALWWALYAHEVEMSASAGREATLREPTYYRIALPYALAPNDPKQSLSEHMVALAHLLQELYQESFRMERPALTTHDSVKSLDLDRRLLDWKASLPRQLDLDSGSLVEPEWLTKQKIVLTLRFYNARILIHRPFLIAAATGNTAGVFSEHVKLCIEASRWTIGLLYSAYTNRPYFRTWWYNTTYALYASMVLLYVVICDLYLPNMDRELLLQDVEKSIEIFYAMSQVTVARRCAEITQEVLEIARRASPPLRQEEGQAARKLTPVATIARSSGVEVESDSALHDLSREDLFASLVEPNFMDGFGRFDGAYFAESDLNSVLGPDMNMNFQ